MVPCIVFVLVGLIACQAAVPQSDLVATDLPVAPPTALESTAESEALPTQAEDMAEPEVAAETGPPTADPTATVDVSPDLRATDPSTVSLAAGHPQLVEFFAFW